jgi:hypothetical protein
MAVCVTVVKKDQNDRHNLLLRVVADDQMT